MVNGTNLSMRDTVGDPASEERQWYIKGKHGKWTNYWSRGCDWSRVNMGSEMRTNTNEIISFYPHVLVEPSKLYQHNYIFIREFLITIFGLLHCEF
jgi:hypothetical protein